MDLILNLIVVLAASAGFWVAHHIRYKKKLEKPFVCPLKFDCHTVVTSDYSRIFGIPLEILGMIYYFAIAASYLIFIGFPSLHFALYGQGVLLISVIAFFFSLYLTYVQAAKLKQWCTLCLFSAAMCTVIFVAVLFLSFV